MPRRRSAHHHAHHDVYVVELSRRVLDERFDKYKAGIQANRFVQAYGLCAVRPR